MSRPKILVTGADLAAQALEVLKNYDAIFGISSEVTI